MTKSGLKAFFLFVILILVGCYAIVSIINFVLDGADWIFLHLPWPCQGIFLVLVAIAGVYLWMKNFRPQE